MSGPRKHPRSPWLRTMLWNLARLFRHDRIVQITTGAALAVILVQRMPETAHWANPMLTHPFFGLLTVWALRADASWIQGREERGFWNDLLQAAVAGLIASLSLPASFLLHSPALGIISLFSLVASYGFLLLAVERRPHEQGWWRSTTLERRLTLPAVLLFVIGLLIYFALVPVMVKGSLEEGLEPTLQLFAVLALVVALRASWQTLSADDPRWRSIYCLFALTMTVLGVFHAVRANVFDLQQADPSSFAVWILPPWLLVLAIRMRHGAFPPVAPKTEDYFTARPPELATRTMLLALGPPLLHFGGTRLGLLDAIVRDQRELWMLVWVAALATVAAVQSYLLARRVRELAEERRRIEQVLAHNEHRLRITAARRIVGRELETARDPLTRAFRDSPDALTLVDLDSGVHLDANERYLELIGAVRADVVGRSTEILGLLGLSGHHDRLRRRMIACRQLRDVAVAICDRQGRLHDALASLTVVELDGRSCLLAALRPGEAPAAAARLRQVEATVALADASDAVRWWNRVGLSEAPPDESPESTESHESTETPATDWLGKPLDDLVHEVVGGEHVGGEHAEHEVWSAPVWAADGESDGRLVVITTSDPPDADPPDASGNEP